MKKKHIEWIIGLFCIDQVSKFIANLAIPLKEEVPILGDFLYLTDDQNFGTAFGIVEGHLGSIFIITSLSLILLYSFYHHTKEQDRLTILGILFMISGLLGNLMDRIFLHYVRDFIGISMFGADFILNFADAFLWAGLIMIIISEIKELKQKKNVKET